VEKGPSQRGMATEMEDSNSSFKDAEGEVGEASNRWNIRRKARQKSLFTPKNGPGGAGSRFEEERKSGVIPELQGEGN